MLTVHPPAFIESKGCYGPRYIRGQPSRETTGVTMTEISDKYIAEFELPYRNVKRYIKEFQNNWNRLSPEQRNEIGKSFEMMNISSSREDFTQTDSVISCGKYLAEDTARIPKLLSLLWNPNEEEIKELNADAKKLETFKTNINDWYLAELPKLHANAKSCFAGILFIIFFILIGYIIGSNC